MIHLLDNLGMFQCKLASLAAASSAVIKSTYKLDSALVIHVSTLSVQRTQKGRRCYVLSQLAVQITVGLHFIILIIKFSSNIVNVHSHYLYVFYKQNNSYHIFLKKDLLCKLATDKR